MADQAELTAAPNGAQAQANGGAEPAKAVQRRAKDKTQVLADFLNGDAVRKRLNDVCQRSLRPEELVRLMLLAASRQPQLLECAQHSILRALMDAAQLGIAPMGIQGRGYIVPRKNNKTQELEANFDPGWRGLCDIARRNGIVKTIDAKIVFETDVFDYRETEMGPKLEHVPTFSLPDEETGDDNTGRIIAAYARAMVDGVPQIEVLRRRDIDRIMNVSMAKSGPWSGWFDEMARKSAVRRLCKYLPYSPDLQYAMQVSDRADGAKFADDSGGRTNGDIAEAIRSRAVHSLPSRSQSAAEQLGDAPPAREAEPVRTQATQRHEARQQASRQAPRNEPEPPFGNDSQAQTGAPSCAICNKPLGKESLPTSGGGRRHPTCSPFGVRGETDGEPPDDYQSDADEGR